MVNIFIDIMEMTLPVSAWIVLLLLCSPLLKRSYVAKWRYYMWMFVAVRLIIPLRLRTAAPITVELPGTVGEIGVQTAAAGSSVSLTMILTGIWILGMAAYAVYQTIRYLSFRRLVGRWSCRMKDQTVADAFERAKREAGIRRKLEIRTCKAVSTPMIFGIFRPVLLMPDMAFAKEDLPAILCHELIHLKRNDILYKLLILCAVMVHWFNPLVYLMVKAANRDIELACDAEVVRAQDSAFRQHYCEAILRIVHNGRQPVCALSTCFIFSKKTVMERFKNILDEKLKKNGVLMFGVIAVSVAVSGGAIGFAAERVAEELEDNLQLVERTPEKAVPTAEESTAEPEAYAAVTATETTTENKETASVITETVPKQQNLPEPAYTAPAPKKSAAVNNVSIGVQKQAVYEAIGEPDTVSGDGIKETYALDDGTTAILQYDENGVLDEGYIVVGGSVPAEDEESAAQPEPMEPEMPAADAGNTAGAEAPEKEPETEIER